MATIPMQNAWYVAAGKAGSWRHYALNIPVYTHFTSPIRRYADVMVHRILTATLEGSDAIKKTYDTDTVGEIALHCNFKRLAAKNAQERSDQVRDSQLDMRRLWQGSTSPQLAYVRVPLGGVRGAHLF